MGTIHSAARFRAAAIPGWLLLILLLVFVQLLFQGGYYSFCCSFSCSYYSRVATINFAARFRAATIPGWLLFILLLIFVQLLFQSGYYSFCCSFSCSYYSRVATINFDARFRAGTIPGWLLFQGGCYSTEVSISMPHFHVPETRFLQNVFVSRFFTCIMQETCFV